MPYLDRGNDLAIVLISAICVCLLSNNSLQWQIQNQDKMNRIKEILERKGVSQTDLAHRLGKTFNMVNLYATNKVQPPIPILYKIAEILDVDIRELLVSNKIDTQ